MRTSSNSKSLVDYPVFTGIRSRICVSWKTKTIAHAYFLNSWTDENLALGLPFDLK